MPVKRFASFRPSQKGKKAFYPPLTHPQTANSATFSSRPHSMGITAFYTQAPYALMPVCPGARLKPIKKVLLANSSVDAASRRSKKKSLNL